MLMKLPGNLPAAERSIILQPKILRFISCFLAFTILLKTKLFFSSFASSPFNFFRWFLVMLWEIPLRLFSVSHVLHLKLQKASHTV